ncbi:MAG: hypothetical protein ACYC7E_16640 [Armatimonadota bacterium]
MHCPYQSSFGVLLLCSIVALLLSGSGLAQQAPAAPRAAVLFTGTHGGGCAFQVAQQLHAAGMNLSAIPYPGYEGTPLTWDTVKAYNIIVIGGLGRANADMSLSEKHLTTQATLKRFLDAGGSLLFTGSYGQNDTERPPLETFLGSIGLTPLPYEMPFDADSKVTATAWNVDFAFTRNIAASPITAGIKSLWYPTPAKRHGAQGHVISFRADAEWTIPVKGEASSFTKLDNPLLGVAQPGPGSYQHAVPLVAYRQVGKGRVAYCAIDTKYLFGLNANTTLEGIVLDRGLRQIPSDGYKLVENSLRWLAEPSLLGNELGGAPMQASLLEAPYKTKFGQPFVWPAGGAAPSFPHEPSSYAGIIGARTAYSSGTGTVEAWVQRARANGLAYLVFLEEFSRLSAENFAKLKADCARLSTADFAAIPGFTIDDEVGNHYFYFGPTIPYPEKRLLSKDGAVFISYDQEIKNDPYGKGQINMTVLNYAFTLASFKVMAGNYLYSQDAAPTALFFSQYDAVGVVTAKGGTVIEDATREYLQLVAFGDGPLPLALTFMETPEQLEATPWRTVLRLPKNGGALIDGKVGKDTKIADYFSLWHYFPDNPTRVFMTSGPEIATWSCAGPRDYGGNNQGDFVWQNLRWQVRGEVKSPVGLKEVTVYDGPRVFRRFLPDGQKAFAFTLDLLHDKQHNLVLVATDLQGGKAVSCEQWDRNHRLEEFQCSDRNNQLTYGYLTNSEGIGIQLGGSQTLATPHKRVMPPISPAGIFFADQLLGTPAFDGGASGVPSFNESISLLRDKGNLPAPNVSESRRLLHTGDVNIGEGTREHYYADNVSVYNVWHTLWRTVPAEDFVVNRRTHFFQINPDSPLAVFLVQYDITLKRDTPNAGFNIGSAISSRDRLWSLRKTEGQVLTGAWEDTALSSSRTLKSSFGTGAYSALLDSPLGGITMFSLTDGLTASLPLPTRSNITFSLPGAVAPQKAGETKRVELLLLGIPRATAYTKNLPSPSTEIVERFYRDFGLDGGKTGYTITPQAGRVTGQRYLLAIDGTPARCFSGQLRGSLISSLPIVVSGINPNWTSYLYDRARHAARPLGNFEGKAWATVCLNGTLDLFIGHPLVADNEQVVLQVTQAGEQAWRVEIHNPTDAAITTTVKKNPFFDPLKDKPFTRETITIPAGSSVTRTL